MWVGGDEDFDGGFVVVDKGVEAFVDEVFELDFAGDEGREVEFAGFDEFDGVGVVIDVGDGAAEIDFFHDNFVHVDGGWFTPDGDDDDFAGGSYCVDEGVEYYLY